MNFDNHTAFGRELCQARKRKGLIQARVGHHVGVSPSLVSQWENSHAFPDANEVFRMEELLDVAPGTLSTHLGYVPLDEKTRLGHDLVAFFGSDRGRQILKGLPEQHCDLESGADGDGPRARPLTCHGEGTMSDNTDAQLDELLEVRAELWDAIISTRDNLIEEGDTDDIAAFADHLMAEAAQWRTLAATADAFCRTVLMTDADRFETTAMELRAA